MTKSEQGEHTSLPSVGAAPLTVIRDMAIGNIPTNWQTVLAVLAQAEAERKAGEAKVAALTTALQPFAKMADTCTYDDDTDDDELWADCPVTVAHLRRARDAFLKDAKPSARIGG